MGGSLFLRDPRFYALLCLGTMTPLLDSADQQSMRLALVARHIVAAVVDGDCDVYAPSILTCQLVVDGSLVTVNQHHVAEKPASWHGGRCIDQ